MQTFAESVRSKKIKLAKFKNVAHNFQNKIFYKYISKKTQRGATQGTQDVYMIPLNQRERRTQI